MSKTVTEKSIKEQIRGVYFINALDAVTGTDAILTTPAEDKAELSLVTICIIILKSGFKVEGVSACVDPANYNKELGQKYAYENAFEKLWQLEGYVLKCSMAKDKE